MYRPHDDEKIMEIRNAVLEGAFVPSNHYEDKAMEKRFLGRLDAEGIQYGVEIKEGKRWITWAQKDDQRVEKIQDRKTF